MSRVVSRPPAVVAYLVTAAGLAVTAVPSGALMVADPTGATLGLEHAWLAGGPFTDFRIPGVVLAVGLGGGAIVAVVGVVRRTPWAWLAAVGLGVALVVWIVVQVWLLRMLHPLQGVYGALGVILVGLATHRSFRRDLAA